MSGPQLDIWPATAADLPEIEAVHAAAFGGELEARLVRQLISQGRAAISLKAVVLGQLAGHILFSPATCSGSDASGLGLAPLAVLPAFQRRGIGSALTMAGLDAARQAKCPWVVVLGEPGFYGRFGFLPASRLGLCGEFGGGDAFQILVLRADEAPPRNGLIRYCPVFRDTFGNE